MLILFLALLIVFALVAIPFVLLESARDRRKRRAARDRQDALDAKHAKLDAKHAARAAAERALLVPVLAREVADTQRQEFDAFAGEYRAWLASGKNGPSPRRSAPE